MKAVKRTVLRLASLTPALAVASALLLGGCFTLTRPALPQVRGSIEVEGLDDRVEIYRDDAGVAHIIATTDTGVFLGQGYVHAQDRFYQMEFWRRIGAGRLSELFGEEVLSTDIYLRTMGFRHIAQQEYHAAPPLMKTALDSYAAGVNAYIAERKPRKLAAEFALLGLQGRKLEIEPWTPLDSITWAKVMSQDMGGDFAQELLRLDVIRAVGVEMARDFFAPFRYGEMPTVIHAEDVGGDLPAGRTVPTPEDDLALLDDPVWLSAVAALNLEGPVIAGRDHLAEIAFGGSLETGSNQWVLAGRHTASGLPHLANDVHLGIQMPAIWYKCSLHVTGPSGWSSRGYSFAGMPGIVIGHNDRIVWGMSTAEPDVQDLYVELVNPQNPDEYLVGDRWVPMEIRHEVIDIEGADPYFLRGRGAGSLPSPGWDDEYQWTGYVPYEELPWLLNPERGYIISANNPVTPDKRAGLEAAIAKRVEGALAARELLADWDLEMAAESIGATVFAQFYVDLCRKTFADQLPAEVWNGPWNTTYGYRMQNALWLLAGDPENACWDDVRSPDVRETRDDILARALASAYEQLEERLGRRTDRWTWGKVHTAAFRNATLGRSGIGIVERLFNRGPVSVPGGADVLRRADFKVSEPFEVHHTASLRMIADTADWSSTLSVHRPGQSGHPASRHYDGMLPMWLEGGYRPHPWTPDEIRAQARRRLVLEPAK